MLYIYHRKSGRDERALCAGSHRGSRSSKSDQLQNSAKIERQFLVLADSHSVRGLDGQYQSFPEPRAGSTAGTLAPQVTALGQ